MNRRDFVHLLGLGAASAAAEPVRRVYSFLWNNPLVQTATGAEIMAFRSPISGRIMRLSHPLSFMPAMPFQLALPADDARIDFATPEAREFFTRV